MWALFVTGGLSRATMPSLGPMVRSRWSQLLGGTALLDAAFSLEGIADELIFITGPVLVVALAAGHAGRGRAGHRRAQRGRRGRPDRAAAYRATARARTRTRQQRLRSPGLRVLIGMHTCLGALFVAVDLATVAFAPSTATRPPPGRAGAVRAGQRDRRGVVRDQAWRAPQASRLTVALAATVLGVAPLAVHAGHLADGRGHHRRRPGHLRHLGQFLPARRDGRPGRAADRGNVVADHRGSDWYRLGAPLAGRLIDLHGATAGYLFAFAAGLTAVAIAVVRRRDLAPATPGAAPRANDDASLSSGSTAHRAG